MRAKLILSFIAICMAYVAKCQDIDSVTLSKLKLNFTVPDMPAFKALGTEPSTILKPSTLQALAVSISSFAEHGKFVIPRAIAVEVPPALLINANKPLGNLKRFRDNKVINSFRISLGSMQDTSEASSQGRSLALGLRISFINEGDFTMDENVHKKISAQLARFRISTSKCRKNFAAENLNLVKEWASDNNPDHNTIDSVEDWDLRLEERIRSDSTIRRIYEKFQETCSEYFKNSEFETWLKNEEAKYKKENWNATKLDLAIAILSRSPDSLVKNIEFRKAEIWLTASLRTGKHSQLLLGINGQTFRDLPGYIEDKRYLNVSIPTRYLLGRIAPKHLPKHSIAIAVLIRVS